MLIDLRSLKNKCKLLIYISIVSSMVALIGMFILFAIPQSINFTSDNYIIKRILMLSSGLALLFIALITLAISTGLVFYEAINLPIVGSEKYSDDISNIKMLGFLMLLCPLPVAFVLLSKVNKLTEIVKMDMTNNVSPRGNLF